MQASRGVDDHDVELARSPARDRFEGNRARIGPRLAGDDLAARPLSPRLQLLARGRAVGVGGRQQDAQAEVQELQQEVQNDFVKKLSPIVAEIANVKP